MYNKLDDNLVHMSISKYDLVQICEGRIRFYVVFQKQEIEIDPQVLVHKARAIWTKVQKELGAGQEKPLFIA